MKNHTIMKHVITPGLALALGLLVQSVSAQTTLYSDNFEADTSANWTVLGADAGGNNDYNAFFAFIYTTNAFTRNGVAGTIPPGPNSGGATPNRGVKMYVNKNDATAAIAAINAYPTSQVFSNDFAVRFDMWLNYNGPAAGGSGSTEFCIFGINHVGDKVNWEDNSTASDGVWFGVTGEGGAGYDYRSYVGDGSTAAIKWGAGSPGVFLDRDGDGIIEDESFYGSDPVNWPLNFMFPAPSFETPGVPGKQWVQIEIRQRTNDAGGHVVTWKMDNYVIGEHSNGDTVLMTQGNAMIGNMDIYSSIANPAADNFVIYDNFRVVDLSGVAPLPVVTVVTNDDTATESPAGDNGSFTITRDGPTAAPLTVTYRMTGTAANGVDYTSLPGSTTLAAGQSSTNITVTPINDTIGEATETVIMVLTGSTNYDLYTNISAIVNLLDDGDQPTANFATFRRAAYELNTNSYGRFDIVFTSLYAAAPVTVNYTVGGTAVNGTHYTTIPTSVTVPAGETNASIYILPIDNSDTVSNRTVVLTLTSGANYVVGSSNTATVTIFNDDLPAAVATPFSDNFEVDSSASWSVFYGTNGTVPLRDRATFAYDYSADGIPPAPRSTGGTTRGLKMEANVSEMGGGVFFSGLSASPTGQNFTGDFRLRVDWWPNFPGPFPAGGSGSTQLGTYGVGSGVRAHWPGGALSPRDTIYFAMSGDGGTNPDIRAYTNGGAVLPAGSIFYPAATLNSSDSYYAVFGNLEAPPAQLLTAYGASQTGRTALGAPGEVWHDVVITKLGNTLTWHIDGLLMAAVNANRVGYTLSTNVFVGQSDINNGQAGIFQMLFSLYDNLVVQTLPVPTLTITNITVSGGSAVLTFTGGANDPAAAYLLQQAPLVTGLYTNNLSATITNVSPGVFRALAPVSASSQFYRILR